VEGVGYVLIQVLRNSARTVGAPAEIRTGHIPSTSQNPYYGTNMLGFQTKILRAFLLRPLPAPPVSRSLILLPSKYLAKRTNYEAPIGFEALSSGIYKGI
jgi:hypothetical protein